MRIKEQRHIHAHISTEEQKFPHTRTEAQTCACSVSHLLAISEIGNFAVILHDILQMNQSIVRAVTSCT